MAALNREYEALLQQELKALDKDAGPLSGRLLLVGDGGARRRGRGAAGAVVLGRQPDVAGALRAGRGRAAGPEPRRPLPRDRPALDAGGPAAPGVRGPGPAVPLRGGHGPRQGWARELPVGRGRPVPERRGAAESDAPVPRRARPGRPAGLSVRAHDGPLEREPRVTQLAQPPLPAPLPPGLARARGGRHGAAVAQRPEPRRRAVAGRPQGPGATSSSPSPATWPWPARPSASSARPPPVPATACAMSWPTRPCC